MKAAPSYDICEARKQIEAGKTTYKKLVEIMELVDEPAIFGVARVWRGTGKFEMREVSQAEFYR